MKEKGKGEAQQFLDPMTPAMFSTKYKNKIYSTMCPYNTESVDDISATKLSPSYNAINVV